MRIAILTTQALHHVRFVAVMAERHEVAGVLLETAAPPAPPFETAHPFEQDRDAFERDAWFGGREPAIRDFAPAPEFPTLNQPEAAALGALDTDLAVVFGTGRLSGPILDVLPRRMVNLHGGDTRHYRGLDTHLWAVYHGDFEALVTTMHHVDPALDSGAALKLRPVPLHREMELKARGVVCCPTAEGGVNPPGTDLFRLKRIMVT